MNNTEELIKEAYDCLTPSECKEFIINSARYFKSNAGNDWDKDEYLSTIASVLVRCHDTKRLSLKQFKLINQYTNVIDVFKNEYKSWE